MNAITVASHFVVPTINQIKKIGDRGAKRKQIFFLSGEKMRQKR